MKDDKNYTVLWIFLIIFVVIVGLISLKFGAMGV